MTGLVAPDPLRVAAAEGAQAATHIMTMGPVLNPGVSQANISQPSPQRESLCQQL